MNKKSLLTLALTLALVSSAHAQPDSLWSRAYGGRSDEVCESLIQTADGGFALAGWTESFGAGGRDFWLVRTDENGDSLWSRTYGGENDDECQSFVLLEDGGYALAGYTESFGAGGEDFWLVRMDENGDSLWSRSFGEGANERCNALVQTADGGYALAGHTSDGSYDFWLLRTDEDGDSLWSHTYGGRSLDLCFALVQTADGGFALAGYTTSFGGGERNFWLVRTDANGDSLWSRSYGGEEYDDCRSLLQTADGGFALLGYTNSYGAGGNDFWLVRTDEEGEIIWSQTFGGRNAEQAYAIIQVTDGGFTLAGTTGSFGAGRTDFWLVRTDENGDSLWSRTYGGRYLEECYSILEITDGEYALAGYSYQWDMEFWLVKCGPSKTLTGTVVVNQTGEPIGGAMVSIPDLRIETTTDVLGRFRLEKVIWDTVYVHIEARGYTTIDRLEVIFSDTFELDIEIRMLHPEIDISPDFVDISVPEGNTQETPLQISNPGDGLLAFSICAYSDKPPRSMWEQTQGANISNMVNDNLLQAALFFQDNFWIAGGFEEDGRHYLYRLSHYFDLRNGYRQSSWSSFGWRNLTCDDEYLYAVDSAYIAQISPDDGMVTGVSIPSPVNPTTAVTWDPDRQVFWISDVTSDIYGVDRDGTTVYTIQNSDRFRIAGMFYFGDYANGFPLYVLSNDPSGVIRLFRLNLQTGEAQVVADLAAARGEQAGGCSLTNQLFPFTWSLLVQMQSDGADILRIYKAGDDLFWLAVTPTEGQVEAGEALDITLALDATGLVVDSSYYAHIQFEHNTPVEGPIWLDVTISVEPNSVGSEVTIPLHFGLEAVFPNPFNSMATITCDLPEAASVTLSAYDLNGREVAAIFSGKLTAGQQRILWDASGLSSGIYLVKLQSAGNVRTARVALVR